MFVTYIYMDKDHHLEPRTAFVTLALLNVIRIAMNWGPWVLNACIRAAVSIRRISCFLNQKDLDMDGMLKKSNEGDLQIFSNHCPVRIILFYIDRKF